jgi:hypothetical protein
VREFFQRISEIKYNICPSSSLDEIARTMLIYFENKNIFDQFFITEQCNEIKDDEIYFYDLKVMWKDLSKLFTKTELENKNEVEFFLYLNIEVGELIISKQLLECFNKIDLEKEAWEVIHKTIKIKSPLEITVELNPEYLNNIKTILTYEKELNILHINFEKEK